MVTQGSSIYEAELIDKVTAPAQHIVKALAQLEAAFNSIGAPSSNFANNMQVISAAMKNVATTAENKFSTRLGMHFNRVSELTNQLGTAVGRSMELIGRGMRDAGLAGIALTTGLAVGLYSTIKAASDATEIFNAFRETFGGANNSVFNEAVKWVEDYTKALGRSSSETQKSLMTFQALFKGLGAENDVAAGVSKSMTALADDFGSFFNKSQEESLQRFIAALSGSSEVLDSFGINIREAAIETKGLELGLGGNIRKMSEMAKTLIRASIIAEVMKKIGAEGDALRTKFEWANQVRALGSAFEKLKISIGELAKTELLSALQSITSSFSFLIQNIKNAGAAGIKNFVNGLLALGGLSATLVAVGTAFMGIGSSVAILSLALAGVLTTIGAIAAGGPIAAIISAIVLATSATAAFGAAATLAEINYSALFKSLKTSFSSITKTIDLGKQAIVDAMAGGDWVSAWTAFKLTAENVFIDLAFFLQDVMAEAVKAGENVFTRVLTEGRFFPKKEFFDGKVELTFNERMALIQEKNTKALEELSASMAGARELQRLSDAANVPPPTTEAEIEALRGVERENIRIGKLNDELEANLTEGVKLAESLESPIEKFQRGLLDVDRLVKNMAIGPVTAKRAQEKLAEEFLKDIPQKPAFKAASLTGTFSGRIGENLSKFLPSMDPLLKATKDQTEILKAIKDNTAKLSVPVF